MWELVLCWFGACNEFLGIGYFCVGVSVSQNRHIAIFFMSLPFFRRTMEEGEIGTVKFMDLDERERCRILL